MKLFSVFRNSTGKLLGVIRTRQYKKPLQWNPESKYKYLIGSNGRATKQAAVCHVQLKKDDIPIHITEKGWIRETNDKTLATRCNAIIAIELLCQTLM